MPQYIALLGAARSGKDTVAARLVSEHGYRRLAFADPLKELALKADPLIPTHQDSHGQITVRLSRLVRAYGWDEAKTTYPEVRRILQNIGQGARKVDPDIWIGALLPKALDAVSSGRSIVVTDVRYLNEAEFLTRVGFLLVRVHRPSVSTGEDWRKHDSETELAEYEAHHTIINDGPLSYLYKQVETLTV